MKITRSKLKNRSTIQLTIREQDDNLIKIAADLSRIDINKFIRITLLQKTRQIIRKNKRKLIFLKADPCILEEKPRKPYKRRQGG